MKYIHQFTLLLILVLPTSCIQSPTNVQNDIKSETKDSVTSYGPSGMVRNIKKGRNGTVLIAASFGGVFQYDGKSFTKLTVKIGSHRFWDVLEDRHRNLWFSTTDSGVYCFNGKSFKHFTTSEGLASNAVSNIYEDKIGNIWFATGGGASCYNGKFFRNFTTKDGLPNNGISTIMEDKTGKIWFGTIGDACFYDGKTFTVFKNKDGKAFYNVRSIIEDRKGNIWFGGSIIKDRKRISDKSTILTLENGLWRYDGNTYTKITESGASAIIEDKKGNIWTTGSVHPNGVGAWKLLRYDQKLMYNKKSTATEIMSIEKMLCGILEADDGSIWFGSLNGVYRYDGKTITDFKRKDFQ